MTKRRVTDVREIQERLLFVAKQIARILEAHEMPYAIAYGTLLGAVRHKGFIPWDDDFDFFLPDERYEEEIAVLRKELPDTIFVEDASSEPKYFHGWAHAKDLRSECDFTLYPQDGAYAHHGISVDLYRAYRMKVSEIPEFFLKEGQAYLERRKKAGLLTEEAFEKRWNHGIAKYEQRKTSSEYCSEEEVFSMVDTYHRCYSFAKDVLPLKKYLFEDTEFYGPSNADAILTSIYGDYMVLPSEGDRVTHLQSVYFCD